MVHACWSGTPYQCLAAAGSRASGAVLARSCSARSCRAPALLRPRKGNRAVPNPGTSCFIRRHRFGIAELRPAIEALAIFVLSPARLIAALPGDVEQHPVEPPPFFVADIHHNAAI